MANAETGPIQDIPLGWRRVTDTEAKSIAKSYYPRGTTDFVGFKATLEHAQTLLVEDEARLPGVDYGPEVIDPNAPLFEQIDVLLRVRRAFKTDLDQPPQDIGEIQ